MRLFHILLLPLCLLFAQVGPGFGRELWREEAGSSRAQRQKSPQTPGTAAVGTNLRRKAQTSDGGHRPQAAGRDFRGHRPQKKGTDLRWRAQTSDAGDRTLHEQPRGTGLLASLLHRSPEYICVKEGGTCNFSPCPLYTQVKGYCYRGKAKCCI